MARRIIRTRKARTSAQAVLGINARNRQLVYRMNERRHFPLADDKLRTKEVLAAKGVPVPTTYYAFSGMLEARRAPDLLRPLTDFVIKPARGAAGSGVLILIERTDSGWLDHSGALRTPAAVRHHVSDIVFGSYSHGMSDRAVVEERLVQAPLLGSTLFRGLPDIRVITVLAVPIMAMLRIPTGRSRGKANLHQGAVGVGVELETGRTSDAIYRGAPIDHHPDTETPLRGNVIPAWSEIIDVATRAARALPLGYLGLDLAVDERHGPMILEVNVRPGLEIQNANLAGLRGAIRALGLRDSVRTGEAPRADRSLEQPEDAR